MTQQRLFDCSDHLVAPTGEQLKTAGIERAASAKTSELAHARLIARAIAENKGTVTADDVAEALRKGGRAGLGNAAGALFQTDEWVFTGERVKSTRSHAHSNELKVWRLK